ncbi:hypothetical protein GCM10029976_048800 [Kribbella albertanoniae]
MRFADSHSRGSTHQMGARAETEMGAGGGAVDGNPSVQVLGVFGGAFGVTGESYCPKTTGRTPQPRSSRPDG